jgi:hypothetical protein
MSTLGGNSNVPRKEDPPAMRSLGRSRRGVMEGLLDSDY